MCQRFINDFTDKIVEKLYFEIADAKDLKRIKEILLKRRDKSLEELSKEIIIGVYGIQGNNGNEIRICYKDLYLFSICYYINSTNNYALHLTGQSFKKHLTREEILKFLDDTVPKEVYNICLNKLKLVEELDSLFMYYDNP